MEDIDYRAPRGLDKTAVRTLAKDSAWVRDHENIFVIGPCGVGKSFLASALAQKACRDGYSALYLRAAALSRELALVRADGSLRHFLARLARIVFWSLMTGPWRRCRKRNVARSGKSSTKSLSGTFYDPHVAVARGALA